jgi:regulator of protease activity HflC (stomatin/prohibitin superfamily)
MSVALIAFAVVVAILVLLLFLAVKITREYERGVIFRFGPPARHPKGPGIFLIIPFVDQMVQGRPCAR